MMGETDSAAPVVVPTSSEGGEAQQQTSKPKPTPPDVLARQLGSSGIYIVVSDPEKHGEGVTDSYVSYCVTTKSNWPQFSSGEFFVRRRFRDFLWLHQQLQKQYPTVLIPPMPEKQRMEYLDRFTPEFLERRRRFLERFLRRIAAHPKLQMNEDFHTFLEAKSWALETAKQVKEDNILDEMASSLKNLTTGKLKHVEERFENLRNYTADLNAQLTSIEKVLSKSLKKKVDLARDYSELGSAVLLLGGTEVSLCNALTQMGQVFEDNNQLLAYDADQTEHAFLDPVKEYILYTEAIRFVQRKRDHAQLEVERIETELEAKRSERADLIDAADGRPRSGSSQTSGWASFLNKVEELTAKDPEVARRERIAKLDDKIRSMEASLDAANIECQRIEADLTSEMTRFHEIKVVDFKDMLHEYTTIQVEHHRRLLDRWESMLKTIVEVQADKI